MTKTIKELKDKWKEKWLIKKESKVWWEKMVDEVYEQGKLKAKEECLKMIDEEIDNLVKQYVISIQQKDKLKQSIHNKIEGETK